MRSHNLSELGGPRAEKGRKTQKYTVMGEKEIEELNYKNITDNTYLGWEIIQ